MSLQRSTALSEAAVQRHQPLIDGSFVRNIDDDHDRSMVQLMVESGHLLGVSVIAEQVETVEQAEALLSMRSDQLQGFRYGIPMDAEALEAALDVTRAT